MGARFPFPSYPRGWFVVAFAADVAPGTRQTVRYFGQELVVFRGTSGKVAVVDPVCPHLGAHLGLGEVQGDCLRCPFHHWAFAADGRCVDVPGAAKIPPKARVRAWPALERNGFIWVWHCPRGDAPQWEPEDLPMAGWTPDQTVRWEVDTHPQEIAENTVDRAHLGPVHDVTETTIRSVEVDGHRMRVVLQLLATGAALQMPDEINDVELDVLMHGLGSLRVHTHVQNAELRARQRIHPTPIDPERVAIFAATNVADTADEAYTREMADVFHQAFLHDFPRDFPIWSTKRYLERPVLSAADGPIGRFRKWARTLYVEPDATSDAAVHRDVAGDARGAATSGSRAAHSSAWVAAVPGRLRPLASRLAAHPGWVEAARLAARVGLPVRAAAFEQAMAPADGDAGLDDAHLAEPAATVSRAAAPSRATPRFRSVDAYFEHLPAIFDPAGAEGLDAVIQWSLTGPGARDEHVVIRDGRMDRGQGRHAAPTLTIQMGADDYLKMLNGDLDGARAFATGRGRLRGPVRLAMRMRRLFPPDRAPAAALASGPAPTVAAPRAEAAHG